MTTPDQQEHAGRRGPSREYWVEHLQRLALAEVLKNPNPHTSDSSLADAWKGDSGYLAKSGVNDELEFPSGRRIEGDI